MSEPMFVDPARPYVAQMTWFRDPDLIGIAPALVTAVSSDRSRVALTVFFPGHTPVPVPDVLYCLPPFPKDQPHCMPIPESPYVDQAHDGPRTVKGRAARATVRAVRKYR
jgi:hypothetical protein